MNQRAFLAVVAAVGGTGLGTAAFGQAVAEVPARPDPRSAPQQKPLSPGLTTQALMQASEGSLLQAQQLTAAPVSAAAGGSGDATKTPPSLLYGVPTPPPHVLKKHDLINVVVREESESATTGDSEQQRSVDFDAKVDAAVRLRLSHLELRGGAEGANPPELKLEGQRDFKGQGTYDRSDTVALRLEGEVIDVKPNGTLVIQAKRHVQSDEESIDVTLTGTCRVQDVDATNSVLSTDLHNMDLKKVATGQVRDTTRRGFIHRLLDLVNPF